MPWTSVESMELYIRISVDGTRTVIGIAYTQLNLKRKSSRNSYLVYIKKLGRVSQVSCRVSGRVQVASVNVTSHSQV